MSFIVPDVPMPKSCLDPCPCLMDRPFLDSNYEDQLQIVEVNLEHDYFCGVTGSKIREGQRGRLKNCKLFECKDWASIGGPVKE